MLELTQNSNNIIGSPCSIQALASKDHARVLLASDSHGKFKTLLSILRLYGSSCDAFLFCGDGASDIAEILECAEEDEKFKEALPPVMAFVAGNGDPKTYPVSFDIGKNNPEARLFPKGTVIFPSDQSLCVNGHNIFMSHGHYYGVDFSLNRLSYAANEKEASIAFYGHTHIAGEFTSPKCRCINPGSCARPRGGQQSSFAIVTFEKDFIDTAFIKTEDYKLWTPVC